MFIDFSHIINFHFDETTPGFMFLNALVKEYNRFEVFLRKAVTQFMSDLGLLDQKQRYYQLGYYNMP